MDGVRGCNVQRSLPSPPMGRSRKLPAYYKRLPIFSRGQEAASFQEAIKGLLAQVNKYASPHRYHDGTPSGRRVCSKYGWYPEDEIVRSDEKG